MLTKRHNIKSAYSERVVQLGSLFRILSVSTVALVGCGLVNIVFPSAVEACTQAQSCSTLYQVNEAFFGTGGGYGFGAGAASTCSTSYCANESLGETGVGNTVGTTYQARAGFNTDRAESLTFIVNSANINLGTLTPGTTATTTATFSVESYLADGYHVITDANPPKMGSYTIHALTTPTSSNSSAEQFGMNLVANTTGCGAPTNFGASPVQTPSSSFSFGFANTNYDTCGKFTYNNGDTIAKSTSSTGETDYTISYIFNTTPLTPGGVYTFNDVLVATGTF